VGSPLDHLAGIGGSGRTRAEAAAAAVGEALERYSATYVPHERIVVACAEELGDEAVEPARFALFSERQYGLPGFPFERFTSSTRVPWIRGWAVADGCPAWLPAELVVLGDLSPGRLRRTGYATSSGTACADTVDGALVPALCELLERDAFMIVWANRLSLPLVDVGADPVLSELEQRVFAPASLAYSVVDLSCFHRLPSLLAIVRAPAGTPGAVGVGAGTSPCVDRAWWKSLAEAFAARAAGATLELLAGDGVVGRVTSFDDHIRHYASHDHAGVTRFVDSSCKRVNARSLPKLEPGAPDHLVTSLVERVEDAGSNAYAVDVTSPDVRSLGLSVVKTLAPELCSLDVVHGARFLGGRRLYEAPVRLGLRGEPLAEDELNPDPHPFP
jgi:ribosomal protein S12 methylthiotransferase accessory factor